MHLDYQPGFGNDFETEALPGALLLHSYSGAAIVPAAITGTFRALPKGAHFLRTAGLGVKIGHPFQSAELVEGRGREALEENTRRVMEAIKRLKDEEKGS